MGRPTKVISPAKTKSNPRYKHCKQNQRGQGWVLPPGWTHFQAICYHSIKYRFAFCFLFLCFAINSGFTCGMVGGHLLHLSQAINPCNHDFSKASFISSARISSHTLFRHLIKLRSSLFFGIISKENTPIHLPFDLEMAKFSFTESTMLF